LHEQVSIFGDLQGPDGRTQNLHAQPLENTHLVELDTDVQSRLTSKSEQDSVWSFLFQYVGYIVGGDGQEEDGVLYCVHQKMVIVGELERTLTGAASKCCTHGKMMRGLDRRNVGVDQDGIDI